MKRMIKLMGVLLLAFMLIPAVSFAQTVRVTADDGVNITLSLDASAQTTYAQTKVDHGALIVKELLELWLQDHGKKYERASMESDHNRMEALSSADKQKVMDLMALCEAGSC